MLIVCDREWSFVGAKGDYFSKQLPQAFEATTYLALPGL